jgi:hypothetical protein
LARVLLDGGGELDRASDRPVVIPGLLGCVEIIVCEIVIAGGRSQRRPHLRICQAAGDRGVASVPQVGGQLAACLLDQQFHEGAGIEVDERHA